MVPGVTSPVTRREAFFSSAGRRSSGGTRLAEQAFVPIFFLFLVSLLAACSGTEDATPRDAAVNADAGVLADSGIADSGLADSSVGPRDSGASDSGVAPDAGTPIREVPRAVTVARATAIPNCTVFADAAANAGGNGSAANPFDSIAGAVAAANSGAVICVAQGTYAEAIEPGEKYFTLAGGFQGGSNFAVRDSASYVTRAQGDGTNVFLRIGDPGPTDGQLTAIDGFEITGYSQAIVRDFYISQNFDITNSYIHDNTCAQEGLIGAAFSLQNISGQISDNVITRNTCGRGGGGAIYDSTNMNTVTLDRNSVQENAGDEPGISHGGGFYLLINRMTLTGNEFIGNSATGWGGGLYVGAVTGGGIQATATLSWNIYRDNRAGDAGGGFFCDDAATCFSDHEIYEANCGGNVFVDSGPEENDPTVASFDHMTNVRGLAVGCGGPGAGFVLTKNNGAADRYTITNSIFWGNETDGDFAVSCGAPAGCNNVRLDVAYSLVQTRYDDDNGVTINFGAGNLAPVDPLFADAASGDFHLRSTNGRWTPNGYVNDAMDSPALAAGDPASPVPSNPARAGTRTELGAFGNSPEASYVQ